MKTHQINFQPDGINIKIEPGVTIMDAAGRAGIVLESTCGGAGTCNKCMVEVAGLSDPVSACQYRIDRDMTVTVPESSRFFEQKILEEGIALDSVIAPAICKHHLLLSPPSLDDLRSDTDRLIDALDNILNDKSKTSPNDTAAATTGISVDLAVLRSLPDILRRNNYAVTAVCHNGHIVTLEDGDTTDKTFGVAVDIGTTTVVASLVNLLDGNTLAIASQTNPQVKYGDDVISRIEHTRANPQGLNQLNKLIIDCVNHLIERTCGESNIDPHQIYELTVVGNASMQHIFLSIPVEQIAQAPYVSAVSSGVNVPAGQLGINIHPQGNIYIMPSIAAHVGGDTVAVALSAAMLHSEKINLAVDIGTNGEIVLGNRDGLYTCSTAAGPAFEGAHIRCGMRGAAGAIERVHINQDVELGVIGGGAPVGICGSGLLDAIAELLDVGLINTTGRLLEDKDVPENVSPALRKRIIMIDKNPAFILADDKLSKNGKPIVLTQRDIRETQLGKAAIRAGITILINQMGIDTEDIDRLYLAGAFGNYIRPQSARRIGLLPEIPLHKILPIGNAAGAGAKEVLLSNPARQHAQSLARQMQYVELAGRSEFQNLYSDCMFFPEKPLCGTYCPPKS